MKMSKKNLKAAASFIMNDEGRARQFIKGVLLNNRNREKTFTVVVDEKVYRVRELG